MYRPTFATNEINIEMTLNSFPSHFHLITATLVSFYSYFLTSIPNAVVATLAIGNITSAWLCISPSSTFLTNKLVSGATYQKVAWRLSL